MEDRFDSFKNEDMSCITQFSPVHIILRRSKMLLKFSRHIMMYNVSLAALCANVTYKGYFAIQ